MTTTSTIDYATIKTLVSVNEIVDFFNFRRRGRSIHCPNASAHSHGDKTPSAWISKTGQSWHCYACNAGGSVIDFVMAAKELSMRDAALALADFAGIPTSAGDITALPYNPRLTPAVRPTPQPDPPIAPASPNVHAFLETTQHALLLSDHAKAYLARRRIPLDLATHTGLGLAARGTWDALILLLTGDRPTSSHNPQAPERRGNRQPRLVAPLTSPDLTLLTLYGRSTVMCPKHYRHRFLPGIKGLFHAKALEQPTVILTEGIFDALSVLAAQLPATAICGLCIRDQWWKSIRATTIILALDADKPGQDRWRTLALTATQFGKRVIYLKPGNLSPHKDLNEYWVATGTLPKALIDSVSNHYGA